jgi:hypothetical protein
MKKETKANSFNIKRKREHYLFNGKSFLFFGTEDGMMTD